MPFTFILVFFFGGGWGAKPAFEEAGVFSPILIPSSFRTQIGWWNWATLRLRLPQGNLRVFRCFGSREPLAGLPTGARGWPPARAAMPTLPRARLPLSALLTPARIQVTLSVGAALGWLGGSDGLDPHTWLSMCSMGQCLAWAWVGIAFWSQSLPLSVSSVAGPCGTHWVPSRGCCWFPLLPRREGSGDMVAERGGSLSKSPWPKLTKPRAVSPSFPSSPCGRGLSELQAGNLVGIRVLLPPR